MITLELNWFVYRFILWEKLWLSTPMLNSAWQLVSFNEYSHFSIVHAFNFLFPGQFYQRILLLLVSGGLDSRGQVAMLRKQPDVIIATPGRLVDHLHNAPSFNLNTIEILVLDEADRLVHFSIYYIAKFYALHYGKWERKNIFVPNFKGRNHLSSK